MKQLSPELIQKAVALIEQLRSGLLDDAKLSEVVEQLNVLLLDPHWSAYTIDHVPELSPEQVVRRAFEYRPFTMPDSENQAKT